MTPAAAFDTGGGTRYDKGKRNGRKKARGLYINTFNDAMKARFGRKTYRLSLDCGFTCPNRDGTAGVGGCIFCSAGGAGNFAGRGESLDEMLAAAKEKIKSKTRGDCRYIAYFQSFSNTYAPPEALRALFSGAIAREDIAALSIATRPDCLPPQTLALLAELNEKKPVWVELGLQTANDGTARRMNRCYPTAVYDAAVRALHERGLEVVTHIMLGLPGETRADMRETVRHAASLGTEGVKLHLTQVLKGTVLAGMYERGEFDVMPLEEYAALLCDLIERLPRETVLHRYTGDGDKKELLAPLWCGDKKRVLNYINGVFRERDVEQGSKY